MELVYKRKDFIVKFFACLFIAVYLLFTFIGSRVFASTETFDISGYSYCLDFDNKKATVSSGSTTETFFTDPEIWNYNILVTSNGNYINFFLYTGNLTYKSNGNNSYAFYSDSVGYNDSGESVGISWAFSYPKKLSDFDEAPANTPITSYSSNNTLNDVKFSTLDIKDVDGNVVFQGASQDSNSLALAPIVEGQEMKPLQEILQILPIVMIVIVGYLALRKGLATLFRFLRTS